jgi:hypothetical protein
MVFVLIIVGVVMSSTLTQKQQAKATDQEVEMFAAKEAKDIGDDSANGQLKILHLIFVHPSSLKKLIFLSLNLILILRCQFYYHAYVLNDRKYL